MRIYLKRVGNALYPDGTESLAEFEKFPQDKTLQGDITQPRNLGHHKLFWALCQRIGTGIGKDAEWVAQAFKIESGHVDIFSYGGKVHLVPRSIAFHKMDQAKFSEFFNECVTIAYNQWGVDPATVADLLVPEETQRHGR